MKPRYLGLTLGLATWLGASVAHAQPARDPAAAEALFVEAKALMASGEHAQACAKFAASHQLDPGVGILLYLGDCQEKAGQLASAWATFREAETVAHQRGQGDREARASERARSLEPRLPKLRIVVPDENRVAGFTVRRGDFDLVSALWGSQVPVDPGTYRVSASAPGRIPWEVEVTARPSEVTTVEVPALAPEKTQPSPPRSPPPAPRRAPPLPDPSAPEVSGGQTTAAIVVGGVGVALVGFGTVSGILAANAWSEAERHCQTGAPPWRCDATGVDAASATDTWGTTSTIAFVAGGAALGAAAVLWLTAPDGRSVRVGAGMGTLDATARF